MLVAAIEPWIPVIVAFITVAGGLLTVFTGWIGLIVKGHSTKLTNCETQHKACEDKYDALKDQYAELRLQSELQNSDRKHEAEDLMKQKANKSQLKGHRHVEDK